MQKRVIAALGFAITNIVTLSTIMGGLFVWGLPAAVAVVMLAGLVTVSRSWAESKFYSQVPQILTRRGFAY